MEQDESQRLCRVTRLLGQDVTMQITRCKAIIFGIGGVGSWTAEALVRTGVSKLTIVDADAVAASNINRQSIATVSTIGEAKVDVMKRRLLDINPNAEIISHKLRYNADTASMFALDSYDYVIDAIDSLSDKALLILNATAAKARLFSSMGAALKTDPAHIAVDEFWKVKGCPLAAALRRRFKKTGCMPHRKFKCVYSDELQPNLGSGTDGSGAMSFDKVAYNGALCHITATFGMILASMVIRDIQSRSKVRLPLKK